MSISVETLVLAGKKSKTYTDTCIANLPKGMIYKGAVSYQDLLPTNASTGDVYTVVYQGTSTEGGTTSWGAEFVWGNYEGTNKWIEIGASTNSVKDVKVNNTSVVTNNIANIDLSGKQDTLIAGDNIYFSEDGTTINASSGGYTVTIEE